MPDRHPHLFDGGYALVQLPDEAQAALRAWFASRTDEIDAVLEPFGFRASEVTMPTFDRPVFRDEVTA